jgi:hypothetical protein
MKFRSVIALASIIALALASTLARGAAGFADEPTRLGPGRKYTSIERLGLDRLRAVHRDRMRYAGRRHAVRLKTGYTDYRAVLHAHAEDSPHTGGTRPELLRAAKSTATSIVMLTDHVRPERDFINDSWRGLRDGVLFIPGAESEGFLVYPVSSIKGRKWESREDYAAVVKEGGGNIFLSHVEEKLDWPTAHLDGLEIYNHHTDAKDEAQFNLWLRGALTDARRLGELERALAEYPQEVMGVQQDYLAEIIAKWDRDTAHHRLTGVAANDCHHNQVFTVSVADQSSVEVGYITSRPTTTRVSVNQIPGVAEMIKGRKPGDLIARLDFDPYERSLSYVSTHILSGQLTEAAVRDALKRGHAYVSHDWLCDPTGFAFVAESPSRTRRAYRRAGVMGDEVDLKSGVRLMAALPVRAILKLFANGALVKTVTTDHLEFEARAAGAYRVEAWLEADGEQRPWLYSNPIYVK